jgi:predicted permease
VKLPFWRRNQKAELDEEIQSHLRMATRDQVDRGKSPSEAENSVRRQFGNLGLVREVTRDQWGWSWLEDLLHDLLYAARMLRKNPAFTVVAVVTLALGIGANTAIFSIVNSVILRPLPYKDSSRIVKVSVNTAMFPTFALGLPWPAFQQIRSQAASLEQTAVYADGEKTLTGKGEPAILALVNTSDGFFEELGVSAELGRVLTDQDQKPGQTHVVVLSDALWRTRFGADPSIIGRTLIFDKDPYTVVGVAQKGFAFPEACDGWLPLSLTAEDKLSQTFFMLQFVGKLHRGQNIDQLKPQLSTIAQRIVKDNPELSAGYSFSAQPLLEGRVQNIRSAYLVLLGAATLVLLIACANLASLLLARGSGRRREMAVRAALGASRGRLFRQGLVESCLLALLGGGLGVMLAAGGIRLFRVVAPADTPRLAEISADSTLLWFSLISSLAAGILFGLAPARRASRMDPNESLKEGSGAGSGAARSTRQSMLGSALVVVEVALAFILLIGSALMAQTVSRLLHQNPGFRTDHLLTFGLPQPALTSFSDNAESQKQFHEGIDRLQQIIERVQQVPGVVSVTAAGYGVLNGTSEMHSGLQVDGAIPLKSGEERHAITRSVYPSYFRDLGMPLLRGREFADRDAGKAPEVVIVNETMARTYWGTLDVLGKRISMSRDDKGKPVWNEVVGLVADAREVRVGSQPDPEYYLSLLQSGMGSFQLFVRTANDPQALAGAITHTLWGLYPDQPVTHVMTMTRIISESVGDQRLHSVLLLVFAAIGFALALVGAYGVISYSVAKRVQEIGIRMALGARPAHVMQMVLRQGLLLVAAGIVIGAAGAFALTRVIASQLYGVKPTDPATFLGAAALVLLVACAACFIPARRATKVDPILALRYE